MTARRQLSLAAILLSLAALGLAACDRSEATRTTPESTPRPLAIATAAVVERAVSTTLEVTGTLSADARTDAAAEIDGRIVQVPVERGVLVAAGAVLARVDDQDALDGGAGEARARNETPRPRGLPQGVGEKPVGGGPDCSRH